MFGVVINGKCTDQLKISRGFLACTPSWLGFPTWKLVYHCSCINQKFINMWTYHDQGCMSQFISKAFQILKVHFQETSRASQVFCNTFISIIVCFTH